MSTTFTIIYGKQKCAAQKEKAKRKRKRWVGRENFKAEKSERGAAKGCTFRNEYMIKGWGLHYKSCYPKMSA